MSATLTAGTAADEATIATAFTAEGLSPARWSNNPGDMYPPHSHHYHKVLFCLRGSIRFRLVVTDEAFELRPGDRLDITPDTAHSAVVGPDGVTCVEAARL